MIFLSETYQFEVRDSSSYLKIFKDNVGLISSENYGFLGKVHYFSVFSSKSKKTTKEMSLSVIGAGIGRTGTESLKKALEELGYGKCYHLFELVKNPDDLAEWEKLETGAAIDHEKLFDGYGSAVDFPAFFYYKDFLRYFPDAKVILTVREADKWYESASKTIFRPVPKLLIFLARIFGVFSRRVKKLPDIFAYVQRVGHQKLFDGKISDPDHCKAVFHSWNEEVKRTVPPEKLLVFEVKQGWEPLCKFLNVPIPDKPFPHTNKGESFQRNASRKVFSSGE